MTQARSVDRRPPHHYVADAGLPQLPGDWTWDKLYAATAKLVAKAAISHKYHVAELATRSRNAAMVYLDPCLPERLEKTGLRPAETLPWHELSEWLMQNAGLKYLPAHRIATQIEKRRVEQIKRGAWREYTAEMNGLIDEVDKKESHRDPDQPPDEDRRVWEDARTADAYDPDEPRGWHGEWGSGADAPVLEDRALPAQSIEVPIDHYYPTGSRSHSGETVHQSVEVLINPTERDVLDMMKGSAASARVTRDRNANVFVWNGRDAIHAAMQTALGRVSGGKIVTKETTEETWPVINGRLTGYACDVLKRGRENDARARGRVLLGNRAYPVRDTVRTIDDAAVTGAAAVESDGALAIWHVTDNPARTERTLADADSDLSGFGNEADELLGGLYGSAAPQIWMGRSLDKWNFLSTLTAGERENYAASIKRELDRQRAAKYITESEHERALANLSYYQQGKTQYVEWTAEQPYNIRSWSPDFLRPLGITPGRQPALLKIRLRGRFVDLSDGGFRRRDLQQARNDGFDGAYTKGGFATTPQLVVWRKAAIVGVERDPRGRTVDTLNALFDRRPVAARAARDPTATAGLRRGYRAAGQMRLRRLRALLRQALTDYDMLGLAGNDPAGVLVAPTQRFNTFLHWFAAEAKNALAGPWHEQWTQRAYHSGALKAAGEVARDAFFLLPPSDAAHLHALARNELAGIAAALAQHVGRRALAAAARKMAPATAHRLLVKPFDKLAGPRLDAFSHFMTVKAHNVAKLDVYRASGVHRVGIVPETTKKRIELRRRQAVDVPAADALISDQDEDDDAIVNVQTAEDDRVCDLCLAIAEAGPYAIDDAYDLIPAHARCRCSFVPALEGNARARHR